MTSFRVERLEFSRDAVNTWAEADIRHKNWPVVYLLDDSRGTGGARRRTAALDDVYVGESLNAASRMRQHLESASKKHLRTVRVVVDETFNKSACLDLESYLIRLLAGDGTYRVLNRNEGVIESDYFNRPLYRESFRDVFDALQREGVFTRTIPEIENSNLFKLSPFKALTHDQAIAVEDILDGLFDDLASDKGSTIVVQGDPGTGKTVVAIYLLKLLGDIAAMTGDEDLDSDSLFSDYFIAGYKELLQGFRMAVVVPQQSLRASLRDVFKRTPGLKPDMVLSPFDVGLADEPFDLLIVDETHRLNQRANQPSGVLNAKFIEINIRLFGSDDPTKTQLDWIRARSSHQIFLVDAEQSVRPADLPTELLTQLSDLARSDQRHYKLSTQMRVQAGSDYVEYVRSIFRPARMNAAAPRVREFDGYDLRFFDDLTEMQRAIRSMESEHGLARLVAGYAWEWKSKNDAAAYDIEIGDSRLNWNSTPTDWIASKKSVDEVGSIHTVQGYDLNYAGVIIGEDLRYDPVERRLYIDRDSYFDKKGKENNEKLGKIYSDEDLLRFITNVYTVLLTRGIRGTFVYVCDPGLRAYFRQFAPETLSSSSNAAHAAEATIGREFAATDGVLHPEMGEKSAMPFRELAFGE